MLRAFFRMTFALALAVAGTAPANAGGIHLTWRPDDHPFAKDWACSEAARAEDLAHPERALFYGSVTYRPVTYREDDANLAYFVNASFRTRDGRISQRSLRRNFLWLEAIDRDALDFYYATVRSARGFSESRMAWIETVEKSLPLPRIEIFQVRTLLSGEVVAMLRIFDGSARPFQKPARDRTPLDRELPFEKSLRLRGLKTDVVEKIRRNFPDQRLFEYGKAYRSPGEVGEAAKALWELEMIDHAGLAELGADGTIFIHTDAVGARLYARDYGAKIIQAVLPEATGLRLVDQTRMNSGDPPGTEYVLMSTAEDWMLFLSDRYLTDARLASYVSDERRSNLREFRALMAEKHALRERSQALFEKGRAEVEQKNRIIRERRPREKYEKRVRKVRK